MGIQGHASKTLLLWFFLSLVFLRPLEVYPAALQAYRTPSAVLHSSGRGFPWVNLTDGVELRSQDAERLELSEDSQVFLEPLSLAAADFDEDGVTDLVSGFKSDGGGILNPPW